jgi:hypothetical protein
MAMAKSSKKTKDAVAESPKKSDAPVPVADQPKASDATIERKSSSKKGDQPTMQRDEAQAIVNKHESLGGDYEPAELVTARKVLESEQ